MQKISVQKGFTLIEGIVAIVIMGIAMVTLTSFLFPQAERSAIPHYQARSAAIGHAMLNEILSRQFDSASDPNGDSVVRCGETNPRTELVVDCTVANSLGGESREVTGGLLNIALADDVDDFIGCWGTQAQCNKSDFTRVGELTDFIPGSDYQNIWAEVNVFYDDGFTGTDAEAVTNHKRISVHVRTTRYGDYEFIAYRSNY
ncbi:prepilin-type N-terminal cleavage/methylation domain-containing protein [Photobacterium sp. SDRW27]|uniref:type IV pilus modification PilV family protein n=1 Tax=Photobacterium obscurum TaxID=2829490 RepID=UPI0022432B9F|nr:prepilin-type N-terminal cleavage/methylation domain-containing protein [Photobacterium obscurum]MCW8330427.1 prepilin-type N-terminal cleavage/methylation domain-containing protein [Photobacterium obscurum]